MIPADIDPDDYDVLASRAVEPSFYRAPYPGIDGLVPGEYQHAGVEYCLDRDNAIVGDAPGVGKSAEAVLLSNAIESRANLVTCPASLVLNWEREIWKWSTTPNVVTYPIRKSSDGVNLKADWVIVSYDLCRNDSILAALLERKWDHHVVDECHYAKDPQGNKRTAPLLAEDLLPSVVGRSTWLTGTLLPNQPKEGYNAIRRLNWDAIDRASLADFTDFYYGFGGGFIRRNAYNPKTGKVESKAQWSDHVRNQPQNLDDFQYRLRKHLMIRRLKEDVLHELPAKRWMFFPISADGRTREALRHPGWDEVERLYEADPDAFEHSIPIDGAISTARRLLGEAKAPGVAAYVEDLLHSGREKVLVGAWHKSVLEILRARLSKYGLVFMDGSTSIPKKQAAVDAFQSGSPRIMLGQMLPLGEGWTLTAAQDAVNSEPHPSPGKNDQFLDRLHRRGQLGSVLGHVPIVPGTLDERLMGIAIGKDINIHAALDKQQ